MRAPKSTTNSFAGCGNFTSPRLFEFLHGSHMVFQIVIAKTRDAVPLIRDFMVDDERASLAGMSPAAKRGAA